MNKIGIKKICVWGFISRLIMLALVMLFSHEISTGLLGSEYTQDDVRYLAGAEIYSKTANSFIDSSAIEYAFDTVEPTGTHSNGMELWYWIVCLSMYLFGHDIFLRLLNILFAIVSIKCIYDICCSLYDKRIAKLAALLYAVLPYPVIFSCFLYKDQFYTMLTLLLLKKAFECAGKIKIQDVVYLVVGLILSQLTRSGVVVLIFLVIVIIIYKYGNYKVNKHAVIAAFVFFAACLGYIVMLEMENIMIKVYAYILSDSEAAGSTLGMFEIKTPGQLYRYPFAYLFALVQPLSLVFSVKCWMDLAALFNIVGLPIAIANFFYLINFKLKKDYFFWISQLLFFVTIIVSLGIIRHQYFLQPFIMIYGAVYIYRAKNLSIWRISSVASMIILMLIWML